MTKDQSRRDFMKLVGGVAAVAAIGTPGVAANLPTFIPNVYLNEITICKPGDYLFEFSFSGISPLEGELRKNGGAHW